MDEFSYLAMMGRIDTAKTLKVKEEIARELSSTLIGILRYNSFKPGTDIHEATRVYRCLTKVLSLYTGKTPLPNFISDTCYRFMRSIMYDIDNGKHTLAYDDFINIFQYVTEVNLQSGTPQDKLNMIKLIGDNKPQFKLKWQLYPSTEYSCILDNMSRNLPITIELETIKRTLPSHIEYTLIEDELKALYKVSGMSKIVLSAASDLLTNMQKSLSTVRDTLSK